MVVLWLILAILLLICAGLAILLLNLRAAAVAFGQFITPAKENELSPLESHLGGFASLFADRITARLTGIAGGQAKREKAVEGAAALDLLNLAAPPWLSAALDLMPELKKKISKNPNMIGPALQMFAGAKGPGGNGNQGEPAADENGGFDL